VNGNFTELKESFQRLALSLPLYGPSDPALVLLCSAMLADAKQWWSLLI
jgi:hypothetical protein